MKFSKLTSALLMAAAVGIAAAPLSSAIAAPDAAKIAERKAKKSQAVGEKAGKAIAKAYELYNAGDVKGAIALLEPVQPTADFDKAYVWKFLGQMLLDKDQSRALSLLEKAAKLDVLSFNDQRDLLKTVGELNMMAGKYEQALNYFNKWMDFTGEKDATVELRIANCYYQMKQYAKVIAPADRAIAALPKPSKDPYTMKFAAYYELKQIKKAIEVLETLLTLFPAEKQNWVYLGQFYLMDEQPEKALAIFDLAYKQGLLKTENEIKNLANLYNQGNLPYYAASLLEKHMNAGLLKKDRTNLMSIGTSYNASREFAKAAKYFGILGELEKDGEAYRRQGESLSMIDKHGDAIVAFNKALDLGVKERGKVHGLMIASYFYQGKMREAHQQVQLARQHGQEKMANSWAGWVKERAEKKGIKL